MTQIPLPPQHSDDKVDDFWAQHKKSRQAKKAYNRATSAMMLSDANIQFTSHNDGAHLVITTGEALMVDFWPGTGLWTPRRTMQQQRGVQNLLNYLRERL